MFTFHRLIINFSLSVKQKTKIFHASIDSNFDFKIILRIFNDLTLFL